MPARNKPKRRNICLPVRCVIVGVEGEYHNGKALCADFCEKDYCIVSYDVKEEKLVGQMQVNSCSGGSFATNWIEEEMYAFYRFDPNVLR